MKYELADKTVEILKHILFVAEKSSKTVQFCFIKGKKQSYINPQSDIFVTFELDEPIKFDYAISNVRTFLEEAVVIIDSEKNKTKKDQLFLPTKQDTRYFESKSVVQVIDLKQKDLQQINKNKFTYLNIIGDNNKFILRYQNHKRGLWFDDGNRKIFVIGKSTRKFRYLIKKEKLSKLFPNNYKLICKESGVLRLQYKHLNYYFKSDSSWQRQQVKNWDTVKSDVKDKHLIALYKRKGFL